VPGKEAVEMKSKVYDMVLLRENVKMKGDIEGVVPTGPSQQQYKVMTASMV
jgi:hypothetical protein